MAGQLRRSSSFSASECASHRLGDELAPDSAQIYNIHKRAVLRDHGTCIYGAQSVETETLQAQEVALLTAAAGNGKIQSSSKAYTLPRHAMFP